jgi:VWFA-related protein
MKNVSVAVALAWLATSFAARQQSAQPPTFSAAADIVEVDVVVQDKGGRFVTGLTPQDFVVREEGTPQQIDLFYVVNGNSRIGAPAGGEGARVAASDGPSGGRVAPRIFIAFFDGEHLTPNGFKRVQAAALELFSKHFKDGDIGGVVVGGAMVNNRLTTVREELVKAVRDAKPAAKSNARLFDERTWPRLTEPEAVRIILYSDQSTLQAAVQRACAEDPDACAKMTIDVPSLIREKARMMTDTARAGTTLTLQSLAAAMNGLSRIDGRKTVLLLSEGFLADESWPLVEQTVGLAARANVRLYTLDARGLDRQNMNDRLSGVDPGTGDEMARLLNRFDSGSDSVNSLAVDTGGFVVRNQNVFDKAIEQIAADASTYYVLGYRPADAPDGKFRKLSVTVNRTGVVARARRGYVATPSPPSTSDAARGSTGTTRADSGGTTSATSPRTDGGGTGTERSSRIVDTARPEFVDQPPRFALRPSAVASAKAEGRAAESSTAAIVPRLRPDAAKHVATLSPLSVGTEEERRGDGAATQDADAIEGWAAYQRGDVESARASLSRAVSRPAAHPWVFYALGQSDYALGHFADAATAWERVRSAAPDFKPVYFDLVDGYLQLKEYDKATRVLRDGDRRWRRDTELLNALGVVQVTRGALDDAVKSFEEAAGSNPADAVSYFNLAKACELRYWKFRRFVSQTRQWIANGNDRNRAIDNYRKYLELGGPLEAAAREGLARLNWTAP